jgi:cytochrome b involved in lipid metabolism
MGNGGKDQSQNGSDLSKEGKKITLEQLGQHRTPDSAWLTMGGKVYDVSGWDDHPGKFMHISCDSKCNLYWLRGIFSGIFT